MKNKQDKGFTLVELLIVIVILGILATVTVFAVRGITDQGQSSACNTDERTLKVALESYYAQEGNALGDVATEDILVTAELLDDVSPQFEIEAGEVVVADNTEFAADGGTGTNPCIPAP
jgi:general secretion pathway protein G